MALDLMWDETEEIAIRLYEEHSNVDPLTVRFTDMHAWIVALPEFTDDPKNAFPGKGKLKVDDERLRQLQRELERVKEERDILKKALAYCAEDQK